MKNGWDKVMRVLDLAKDMGLTTVSYKCYFNACSCQLEIMFMEDLKLASVKESVLEDMKEMINKRDYVISRIEVNFSDYLNLVSISFTEKECNDNFMNKERNDNFMNNCCCSSVVPMKADLGWNK